MTIREKFGMALTFIIAMAMTGCNTGNGGGEEELLEVTHVNGFQGVLSDGSLIEIEVPSTTDGNQNFTLYINGVNSGTGTCTLSGGSITTLTCSNPSLTYSGGVRYSGIVIPIRRADGTVWVH
ncbi:hypothetical protein AGMMS50268_36600 [Spirochaetia bacterium]|nr:hypothetical protein AGMMS50268_36600 [Spirochaetia bacterium]